MLDAPLLPQLRPFLVDLLKRRTRLHHVVQLLAQLSLHVGVSAGEGAGRGALWRALPRRGLRSRQSTSVDFLVFSGVLCIIRTHAGCDDIVVVSQALSTYIYSEDPCQIRSDRLDSSLLQ